MRYLEKDRKKVLKYLSDFVQYHGDLKELSTFRRHSLNECFFLSQFFFAPQFTSHILGYISTDLYDDLYLVYDLHLWLALNASNANSLVFHRFDRNFMEFNLCTQLISVTPRIWAFTGDSFRSMLCLWIGFHPLCTFWILISLTLLKTSKLNFAFCTGELGERMSGAFGEISETIERFQWYKFPTEIQKTLPIIMNEAHEPAVLNCFGSTACLRASFKVVSCGSVF